MAADNGGSDFDPYYKWLGIPAAEQPCNHYRLLGLNLFEADRDVISSAADRQMAFLRSFQAGNQANAAHKLLNEVSAARRILLDSDRKSHYDNSLRQAAAAVAASAQPAERVAIGESDSLALSTRVSKAAKRPLETLPAELSKLAATPRGRKPPKRRLVNQIAGLLFLLLLMGGTGGIGYTVFLNGDRFSELNPQPMAASDPVAPQAQHQTATPERRPPNPPVVAPAEAPAAPTIQKQREALPSNGVVVDATPEQSESFTSEPLQEDRIGADRDASQPAPRRDLSGFGQVAQLGEVAATGRVALPPTSASMNPTPLCDVNGAGPEGVQLDLYSCRVLRDSPALTIKQHTRPGRWVVLENASPKRLVAHFGVVDGTLQFVWAPGTPVDLAELLCWSFLRVKANGDAQLLRFSDPQPLPPVRIDLSKAETGVSIRMPVIYPEQDLRMDLVEISGSGSWLEEESSRFGLVDGAKTILRNSQHPHLFMGCRFNASGKRISAEIHLSYRTPNGKEFGLTAPHVARSIGRLQAMLAQVPSARSAAPGLKNDIRQLRRLVVNNFHLEPKLARAEADLRAANLLVANEPALRNELAFMQGLVPIGEEIHEKVFVTCRFYVVNGDSEINLTSMTSTH